MELERPSKAPLGDGEPFTGKAVNRTTRRATLAHRPLPSAERLSTLDDPKEHTVNLTIIGTGNMGRSIANLALAGGHAVTLLGTSTEKAQRLAAELSGDVRTGALGDPISGDVVVLAVWYPSGVRDVLQRYSGQLDGKVVVDISNPIDPDAFEPIAVEAGSVAQEVAAAAPGRQGRQGLQHHVRRHPARRSSGWAAPRYLPRVG